VALKVADSPLPKKLPCTSSRSSSSTGRVPPITRVSDIDAWATPKALPRPTADTSTAACRSPRALLALAATMKLPWPSPEGSRGPPPLSSTCACGLPPPKPSISSCEGWPTLCTRADANAASAGAGTSATNAPKASPPADARPGTARTMRQRPTRQRRRPSPSSPASQSAQVPGSGTGAANRLSLKTKRTSAAPANDGSTWGNGSSVALKAPPPPRRNGSDPRAAEPVSFRCTL
jgi:hypothetical protein